MNSFVNSFNHVARRISNNKKATDQIIRQESNLSYSSNVQSEWNNNGISSPFVDLEEKINNDIGGILLGHDLPTTPIEIITPARFNRGIQPSDVPLKLCINYGNDNNKLLSTSSLGSSGLETTLPTIPPIHAILRHLVSVNELLLKKCRPNHKYDTIALRNISRREDCVDIDETEFVKILQNYTQQSLEYGKSSTFTMNLRLLEAKLYERYIVGKKLIEYDINQLSFTFAGQHNIRNYVDRINSKYDKNNDKLYFEDCSKSILDSVYEKLQKSSAKKNNNNNSSSMMQQLSEKRISKNNRGRGRSIKEKNELQLIASTKQGIEQTLIALCYRWPTLPNRNSSIYDFMKNNLKLFEDEYQLFNEMKSTLFLKHCESLWKYLDKLYIIKQGKWYQIPRTLELNYKNDIKDKNIKLKLKQFVNMVEHELLWEFLREWLDFMERRLCDKNKVIKYADKYTLKYFLEKDGLKQQLAKKVLDKFPDEIKLSQTGSAYHIVALQYKNQL